MIRRFFKRKFCSFFFFFFEGIPGNYYEMCSFSDSKLERLVEKGSDFQLDSTVIRFKRVI